MEIGNKINQLRKLSGMTQEQLAEKLNVSRQTISKWESDSTSPDLESIVKISRIFHVSLDDLLKEGEAGVANKTDEQITLETSVYKGYKQDKIEMRGDRAEMSDFPLYLNTVAGGLDRRDQTIGGFSFVVKIYAVPVIEIIG